MSDVRTILERGVGGATPPPDGFERMLRRHDHQRRTKRIAAGVVGLAITIALGLAGTSILRSDQSTPAHPTLPLRHNGPIALAGNAPGDGHGIVTLIDPQTGSRSELTVCPVCSEEGFVDLAWSPDGMKVAFTSYGGGGWPDGVFDVATNQTTTIATCDPPDPDCIGIGNVDWSPDGSRIALGQGRRLDLVDADGSNRTMLADFSGERGYVYGPTWSPDGTRIAVSVAFEGSAPKSRLYVVDADGSNLQMLIERPEDGGVRAPDWSPDGSRIAYIAFVGSEDPPYTLGHSPRCGSSMSTVRIQRSSSWAAGAVSTTRRGSRGRRTERRSPSWGRRQDPRAGRRISISSTLTAAARRWSRGASHSARRNGDRRHDALMRRTR
jgi:dipeptidyl aminopeptidase/acylaminoacyl peptidase